MKSIPIDLFTRLVTAATNLSVEDRRLLDEFHKDVVHLTVAEFGPPLLLTQKDAAIMLAVDRSTVRRQTEMGILTTSEIMPGTYRYKRSEIEALAEHGYRHLLKQKQKAA